MQEEVLLVYGGNGITGLAFIEAVLAEPESKLKKVVCISRTPPFMNIKDSRYEHWKLDLLNPPEEIARILKEKGGSEATQAHFFAYIGKESEEELIKINVPLFQNALDGTALACPNLKLFHIQTGYKYYGVTKGGDEVAKQPFMENCPRTKSDHFYYHQEDALHAAAKKINWKWLVTRPCMVIGAAKISCLAVTLALYAALCKAVDAPFRFPGADFSYTVPGQNSTAHHNAEFQVFLLNNPSAWDDDYNICDNEDGDKYDELWPKLAGYFGAKVEQPPPLPEHVKIGEENYIAFHTGKWANTHDLKKIARESGVDEHAYDLASWDFLDWTTTMTWPVVGSLEKARKIGWGKDKDIDTFQDGYVPVFEKLKQLKIIPDRKSLL